MATVVVGFAMWRLGGTLPHRDRHRLSALYAGTSWASAYNRDAPLVGQVRGSYDGIRLPDRVTLRNLSIVGFHAGIRMTGGQRILERVRVFNCYYGIFLERNAAHHGDFLLLKCDISGRFACVGLAPEATWFATAITTIFNQSPYAFFKIASNPAKIKNRTAAIANYGDHWPSMLEHSSFKNCQFESIGNTIFSDGNLPSQHDLRHVDISCCAFVDVLDRSFPATSLHPAGDLRCAASVFDVYQVANLTLRTPMAPERWPVRKTMFRASGGIRGAHFEGIDEFVTSSKAVGNQVFDVVGRLGGGEVRLRGSNWIGGLWRTSSAGAANTNIVRGDLLGLCENLVEQHCSARPGVVGVAMEANVAGKSASICVAELGATDLLVNKEAGAGSTSNLGIDVTYSVKVPGKIRQAGPNDPVIGRTTGSDASWSAWPIVFHNTRPRL